MTVEFDWESFPQDTYRSVVETILSMNSQDGHMIAWPTLALSECMQMLECVGEISGLEKKKELHQLLCNIQTITIKYDLNIIEETALSLHDTLAASSATISVCVKEDKVHANMWTFAPWVIAKMYYLSTIQLQALANRLSLPGQASWRWHWPVFTGYEHDSLANLKVTDKLLKEIKRQRKVPSHFHVSDLGELTGNVCRDPLCIPKLRQCYGSAQPSHVPIDINWNSLAVLGTGPQVAEAIINIKTLMLSLVNAHERRWMSFQPMCTHITIMHGSTQDIRIDSSSIHITDDFQSSQGLPDLIEKSLCTQSVEDASLATVYNYANKEYLDNRITTHVIMDDLNKYLWSAIDFQFDTDHLHSSIVNTLQRYGMIPFASLVNSQRLHYSFNIKHCILTNHQQIADIRKQVIGLYMMEFIQDQSRCIWEFGKIRNMGQFTNTKTLCVWRHIDKEAITRETQNRDILVLSGPEDYTTSDILWAGPARKFKWRKVNVIRTWVRVPLVDVHLRATEGIELVSVGNMVYRIGSVEDLEDLHKCIPQKVLFTWDTPLDKHVDVQSGDGMSRVAYMNPQTLEFSYTLPTSDMGVKVYSTEEDAKLVVENMILQYTDIMATKRQEFPRAVSLSKIITAIKEHGEDIP